ncbi:MAG TPA: hypothetical protein VJM33_15235 [Microthrixaceae bacterium]|nr:hypothetical protein [Microthrixaceae bacterium]
MFSSLNGRLFERIRLNCDFNYSIVAMGNDRMLDNIPAMQRSAPPHRRFSVVCRDVARSQAPGEHIPSIEEAVTLLNDAHRSETMFLPHTAASLEDRLTTVPDYTTAHLLAAGSAVVGVRDHPVHVTVEDDHGRRGAVQETAVDAGCGPNGGDDLVALVGSWCTRLADEGVEELAIAASAGSPACEALANLGVSVDYAVNIFTSDPGGQSTTAAYIDQALI